MGTIKAEVIETDEKHFIRIEYAGKNTKIPLSDDKPNDVKSAFNDLIEWVKEGEFWIEMDDAGTDLFSEVAAEYISQLNREIQEVRKEMKSLRLIDDDEET
jgi:hypothetical protein